MGDCIMKTETLQKKFDSKKLPIIMQLYEDMSQGNSHHREIDKSMLHQDNRSKNAREDYISYQQSQNHYYQSNGNPQYQEPIHHPEPSQNQEPIKDDAQHLMHDHEQHQLLNNQDARYPHYESQDSQEDPFYGFRFEKLDHHIPSKPTPSQAQQVHHHHQPLAQSQPPLHYQQDFHQNHSVRHEAYDQSKYSNSSETPGKRMLSYSGSESSISMLRPPTKSRKKGVGDARWSKRFTWPEDLHANFVSAIFDVGLKHASPTFFLEHASEKFGDEQINMDDVKPYLQRYRYHQPKSQRDFLDNFTRRKDNLVGANDAKSHVPLAGATAAYLSYIIALKEKSGSLTVSCENTMKNESSSMNRTIQDLPTIEEINLSSLVNSRGELILPRLTDEEKRSSVGTTMGYFLGLFLSLKEQISKERETKVKVGTVSSETPKED